MSKKVEFVKPVLQIDKFFKVADHLIKADDYELVQLGRALRQAYENQMMEMDVEDEVERESQEFQENEALSEIPGTEGTREDLNSLVSNVPKVQPLEEQLARNEKEIRDLGKHLQNPAECKTGVCD